MRIPPYEFTVAPTPPPDIDVEAWERSLDTVAIGGPQRLCLTHFGRVEDVAAQLERLRRGLRTNAERARDGDREQFLTQVEAEIDAQVDGEAAVRLRQTAPGELLWLGLERYWRKRDRAQPETLGYPARTSHDPSQAHKNGRRVAGGGPHTRPCAPPSRSPA